MRMFTEDQYWKIHSLVFRPDYSGYKPEVKEIPNGDEKVDADKKYAHVALKYFKTEQQKADLLPYLEMAHQWSMEIALSVGSYPFKYWPDIQYGALRILDYPAGAVSNKHEDFDLFTLMLYRDQPECFKSYGEETEALKEMKKLNPQVHIGQLGTEIGLGAATPHEVIASDKPQHSIVYFNIPDHKLELPSGVLVKDWLNERMSRSRTYFENYK